jgi:hypothetical protein
MRDVFTIAQLGYRPHIPVLVDENVRTSTERAGNDATMFLKVMKSATDVELGSFMTSEKGDSCPKEGCDGVLQEHRGIELGRIYI